MSTDPTIAFGATFFAHSVAALGCGAAFFALPGIAVQQAMGIDQSSRKLLDAKTLLMACAVGMCTFGPFSLLCCSVLKFTLVTVLLCWLIFTSGMWLLGRFHPIDHSTVDPPFTGNVTLPAVALAIAAALAAVLPTISIYPHIIHGGLYVGVPTADHVKVAFTDAIAREGLPLQNPCYAPGGQRILLSYSYGWYVLAAEIKKISRATGWQAEVALTWLTTFSILTFLAAQAWRLSGKARAGIWLILLFLIGPLSSDLLPMVLGSHWLALVGLPSNHGLELPTLQLAWAPQHVFSALAVVLAIWLTSIVMAMPQPRWRYALMIGLLTAAGFEASCWVGGVALIAASPLLVATALSLRLPLRQYIALSKILAVAMLVCILFCIPLLRALTAGTAKFQEAPPIGFAVFPSTLLEEHLGLAGHARTLARIVLYWIHLLPLSFGAIYIVGLPAMLLWIPREASQRALRALSIGATIGFLLVSQFIRSTISANDLGWRSVNVPVMLMMVWAAIALASLFDRSAMTLTRWRISQRMTRLGEIAAALSIGILTLGLLATLRLLSEPMQIWPPDIEQHRLFAQQVRAWEIVRHYTKPTDLVQCNPEGFRKVSRYPINLPYHLLADRSTAYACIGTGRTYAFRYPRKDNDRQFFLTRNAFSDDPAANTLRKLRFKLHVKAIVVTPEDAVWATDAIERSGLYRRVAATDSFRVYIASARATATTKAH